MSQPLVIAYHLIWTSYGTWLPNDPRGSGSKTVISNILFELGELHTGRKIIQPSSQEIRSFYERVERELSYPVMRFDSTARKLIGQAFGRVIDHQKYTCYGCAIMPDHVHLLIRKHRDTVEQIIENLKEESARCLRADSVAEVHPVWAEGLGWRVFLDHPDGVDRTIGSIQNNPLPYRLPIQDWGFVKGYDRWPLCVGHSENSPYVKRLKAVGRYPFDGIKEKKRGTGEKRRGERKRGEKRRGGRAKPQAAEEGEIGVRGVG